MCVCAQCIFADSFYYLKFQVLLYCDSLISIYFFLFVFDFAQFESILVLCLCADLFIYFLMG